MSVQYSLNEQGIRPWGKWEVIGVGMDYIVKRITVNPNSSLSLQLHHHRKEHWIIVAGEATVTIGNNKQNLHFGESVDIAIEQVHRMENLTNKEIVFIEMQMGTNLDENDIERLEDQYNRK